MLFGRAYQNNNRQQYQRQPQQQYQRQPQRQQIQQSQQFQQPRQQMQQPQQFQQPRQQQQAQNQQHQQQQQPQKYYDPSVTFEPLSNEMLKLMGSGAAQNGEAAAGNVPSEVPTAAATAEKREIPQDLFTNPYIAPHQDKIAELIQDEHNGLMFYKFLLNRLTDGTAKTLVSRLVADNEKRLGGLNGMYAGDAAGGGFEPRTAEVTLDADLQTCYRLAVAEESKIIEKMIDMTDGKHDSQIGNMLFRKLNNVNLLISLFR
jgi:hypothetical protein